MRLARNVATETWQPRSGNRDVATEMAHFRRDRGHACRVPSPAFTLSTTERDLSGASTRRWYPCRTDRRQQHSQALMRRWRSRPQHHSGQTPTQRGLLRSSGWRSKATWRAIARSRLWLLPILLLYPHRRQHVRSPKQVRNVFLHLSGIMCRNYSATNEPRERAAQDGASAVPDAAEVFDGEHFPCAFCCA
jgi:hypothetical protein